MNQSIQLPVEDKKMIDYYVEYIDNLCDNKTKFSFSKYSNMIEYFENIKSKKYIGDDNLIIGYIDYLLTALEKLIPHYHNLYLRMKKLQKINKLNEFYTTSK